LQTKARNPEHSLSQKDRPNVQGKKKHVAGSIRLPGEMVETLKVMAESEGERGYQTMVRKWIEEPLHQEARK
jgi:predicted DNA binding CopG/RHH family protein